MLPDLIAAGRLHTVRAPQFAVTCQEREPVYTYTVAGRDSAVEQLAGAGATRIRVKHYKGLASMQADELLRVCVNPATRRATQLTQTQVDAATRALAGDTPGS